MTMDVLSFLGWLWCWNDRSRINPNSQAPSNPQATMTKLTPKPASQSVALPVKFWRGRLGRARLRRADEPG